MMKSETAKKNIYVVIGMARSGTSAIARGLKALGIDLGDKLEKPQALWNPKGFWEDTDIVFKVNRAVMLALNYNWFSVNRIDALCRNNSELNTLKKYAIKLLTERLTRFKNWGFKDPRTAKILPFWDDVFTALNVSDHYVIVCRNPLASAYSYQRVSGSDIEFGLLLWLMHLLPAIEGTQGKKRMMVSYEKLLQNPRTELMRIKSQLAIPTEDNEAEIERYQSEFLDKKLQHFNYSHEDLVNHPATAVAPICVKMHALFMQVCDDQFSLDSPAFLSAWQEIKREFDSNYPLYCYLDVWQKRHKGLERELRSIRRSIPWLLLYPLRIVDDMLRTRRRKKRLSRRLAKSSNA